MRTGISPDFAWIFTDWISAVVFPGVFSPWSKKRGTWKKACKKCSSKLTQKYVSYSLSKENVFFFSRLITRYFSHVTKSRIFKNLNLRRKADHNFCGSFLKNHFRHLKIYSNPPSRLARSRCHMGTFWKAKDWSSHFWEGQPFRFWYIRRSSPPKKR